MDSSKFDAIAKSLAAGKNRRTVIGGIFAGALAMSGLSRAAGAPADKVSICHYDAEADAFELINVSGNALDAHLAHGDVAYQPSVVLATLTLDPTNPYSVDTGVFLADGQSVDVTITGLAGWCCGLQLNANGEDELGNVGYCGSPATPFPCGSVVGAIGGGDFRTSPGAFSIVGTANTVTASGTSGNLVLQYVDGCAGCYSDNNGSLLVTISSIANC